MQVITDMMPTRMVEGKFLGVKRGALITAWVIFSPSLITVIAAAVMLNSINSRLIRANEAVQANGEALAAILEQLEANGEALEAQTAEMEALTAEMKARRLKRRELMDKLDALNLETVEINSGAANSERRLSDFEALEQPQ